MAEPAAALWYAMAVPSARTASSGAPEPPDAGGSARRVGPVVAVASVAAVAVGAWLVAPRLQGWTAERRALAAFEEVVSCLGLGADSTDEALRRRAIRAEMTDDPWPRACAQHLTALTAAVHAASLAHERCDGACCTGDASCVALARAEDRAMTLKAQLADRAFAEEAAAALLIAAGNLGWEVPAVAAESPASGHLSVADVPPLSQRALSRAALCTMRPPSWWLLLHHANHGGTVCELGLPEPTARCHVLPPSVPSGGDLYLVDGGLSRAPRLFAGQGDDWAMFTPAGKRVAVLPASTVGATALSSGGAAALVREGEGYAVVVGGETRFSVAATSPPLLYVGYVLAQRGSELSVYSIDDGERVLVGALESGARATMRGCVASDVVAVRVRDDELESDVLVTQRGGAWSSTRLPKKVPPFTLSCHGDTAHLTWLETLDSTPSEQGHVLGRHRAHDLACSASGCSERSGVLSLSRHSPRSRFFIASLGEDVAVLWRSPLGDVRARLGPPGEIARRAVIPVVEDAAHGGFAWDDSELRLLSAERSAVLLLDAESGVHGIVLDGNGARALTPP